MGAHSFMLGKLRQLHRDLLCDVWGACFVVSRDKSPTGRGGEGIHREDKKKRELKVDPSYIVPPHGVERPNFKTIGLRYNSPVCSSSRRAAKSFLESYYFM